MKGQPLPINQLKGNPPREDCSISNVHRCKKLVSFDLPPNPRVRNPELNPYSSYYTSRPPPPLHYQYNPPHSLYPPPPLHYQYNPPHSLYPPPPLHYQYNPPHSLYPPPPSHYKKPPLYPKNNTTKYTNNMSKSEELYRKYNGISPDEEAMLLYKLLTKETRTIGTQTD